MLQNEQEVRNDSSERSHDLKERDVEMTHTFAAILAGAHQIAFYGCRREALRLLPQHKVQQQALSAVGQVQNLA